MVADVESLNDQPVRLINLGRSFGTTSLTMDEKSHPVSFLVRVTLDTTRPARLPRSEVRRQVQASLEGQVPDSKTMFDVLQLVTSALGDAQSLCGGGGMGGGAGTGGMGGAWGGGMAGGGAGGAWAVGGGMAGGGGLRRGCRRSLSWGLVIINRMTVPGPRQVLLHVKIARSTQVRYPPSERAGSTPEASRLSAR